MPPQVKALVDARAEELRSTDTLGATTVTPPRQSAPADDSSAGTLIACAPQTFDRKKRVSVPESKHSSLEELARKMSRLKSPTKAEVKAPAGRDELAIQRMGLVLFDQAPKEHLNFTNLTSSAAAVSAQGASHSEQKMALVPRPLSSPVPVQTSLIVRPTSTLGLPRFAGVLLHFTGVHHTYPEMRLIKKTQRNGQNFWKPEFIYPADFSREHHERNLYDRTCLLRTTQFICYGLTDCAMGDCLCQLQTSDVSAVRQQFDNRLSDLLQQHSYTGMRKEARRHRYLVEELSRLYDRTHEKWSPIKLPVSAYQTFELCPAAYLLLCGCSPTLAYTVTKGVRLPKAANFGCVF